MWAGGGRGGGWGGGTWLSFHPMFQDLCSTGKNKFLYFNLLLSKEILNHSKLVVEASISMTYYFKVQKIQLRNIKLSSSFCLDNKCIFFLS